MPANSPFLQVRDFYLNRYRPIYDHFVTNGEVPQELHAEVAAAFDHLFRIAAFDKWNELFFYADKFSKWASSKKVARATAKSKRGRILNIVWSIGLTVFGAVLGVVLSKVL